MRACWVLLGWCGVAGLTPLPARMSAAQGNASSGARPIGSVSAMDAAVTSGSATVQPVSGRTSIVGSGTVTARTHTAPLTLTRGGVINVCLTSGLHLAAGSDENLLMALERGAIEIHMNARPTDVIITPDLRLETTTGGPLDLRIRVSSDGDTCVENRGKKAPVLNLADAFGESTYEVRPGQHVLFEHGSLLSVVDRETTPCGCPPEEKRRVPIAEALLHGGPGSVTPKQAAAANPFPEAASAGLAPATPVPEEAPGVTHTQISTTITFDPGKDATASAARDASGAPKPKGGPLRAVARFFKHIFVR